MMILVIFAIIKRSALDDGSRQPPEAFRRFRVRRSGCRFASHLGIAYALRLMPLATY